MSPDNCNSLFFFFVFLLILTSKAVPTIFIADKGILPLVKDSAGIRIYLDIENNNRATACRIYSRPKKCCIMDIDTEDCDVFEVYGGAREFVEPKDRTTLLYVLPIVQQHDLVGYCDLLLDYYCLKKQEQLQITIQFDTRLEKKFNMLLENYNDAKTRKCDTVDLDSLNNCLPVDCEQKYLGKRSFFDGNINKCIETPVCIGEFENEMPSVVYIPNINVCSDLNVPLSMQDIYAMSTGLGTIKAPAKPVQNLNVELKSNCSTISQNLYFLRDLMYGKFCPCLKNVDLDFSGCCKSAVSSIIMCIISICFVLVFIICGSSVLVWIYKRITKGDFEDCVNQVKNKFKKTENFQRKRSRIDTEVRNALLREVLVKDIPLELRDSVVSICDRMENEVRKKKRYRRMDIGSQISLQRDMSNITSSSSSDSLSKSNKDAAAK